MPVCSIVIPWHRGIADLRRAVDSALAQEWIDLEVIVVANGVSDGDFAAVAALDDDPRYRAVRLPTAGAGSARNHGAQLAAGELIFFLDADDRFHPGKLSRVVEVYRARGFDVAFSRGMRVRAGNVAWPWPVGVWDGTRPIAEYFFCDGCTISASALVLAARARDDLPFAEPPYEDPDLLIRAEHKGLEIVMLPEALYDYIDDRVEERLSAKPNWSKRLAWIDQTPPNVTRKARAAFRARCVAQHVFPHSPLACLRAFAGALRERAVPPRDVALFVMRGLIPEGLRRWLVERYFLRRASRFAASEAEHRPARAKP